MRTSGGSLGGEGMLRAAVKWKVEAASAMGGDDEVRDDGQLTREGGRRVDEEGRG